MVHGFRRLSSNARELCNGDSADLWLILRAAVRVADVQVTSVKVHAKEPRVLRGLVHRRLFFERRPGRHLRRLKRFLTPSWAPVGPSWPPSWAVLGRLGGTWPPTWWPKSTNIVQKSMPRSIASWSPFQDRCVIDRCSRLVHPKTN